VSSPNVFLDSFPYDTYKPGVPHPMQTVVLTLIGTLLLVPKFVCERWRPRLIEMECQVKDKNVHISDQN
jgi:hypothetical protein